MAASKNPSQFDHRTAAAGTAIHRAKVQQIRGVPTTGTRFPNWDLLSPGSFYIARWRGRPGMGQ